MDDLRNSIFRTVCYLDLFEFAPTLLELEQWLLKDRGKTQTPPTLTSTAAPLLSSLQTAAESDPRISHSEGFYFLVGREQLIEQRKQKYNFTEEKWKHVRPYLRLLASLPHVRAIFLANAMGWSNARRSSDIDLVVVTTPGRIWTTRLFTAGLMKLFRQRPGEQSSDRAICLSFYVTSDHLDLADYRLHDHDVPFAFWVSQQYPVYDPHNLHEQLYKQNSSWLHHTFAHLCWPTPTPRRNIMPYVLLRPKKLFLELLPLESFARWIQQRIMPQALTNQANTSTHVVINEHVLKLHTTDHRQEQLAAWEQRCAKSHV